MIIYFSGDNETTGESIVHNCMTGRGVSKQHSVMVTSSLTGAFREKGNPARMEFLSMIRNGVE